MRLINTHTLEITDFSGRDKPDYAILSHTWSPGDEISFKDFNDRRHTHTAGYQKIVDLCRFAQLRKQEWAWIHTCCVDHSSQNEKAEAINYEFSWYHNAEECYVYLKDVPSLSRGNDVVMDAFYTSRWFTRAFALPELLAPKLIVFVNTDWEVVGFKTTPIGGGDHSVQSHLILNKDISKITGIPTRFLEGEDLSKATVEDKLDWACGLKASMLEDSAYSLMGIFDIQMPVYYGEGTRAFRRLLDEISYRRRSIRVEETRTRQRRGRPARPPAEAFDPPFELTDRGIVRRRVPTPTQNTNNYQPNTTGFSQPPFLPPPTPPLSEPAATNRAALQSSQPTVFPTCWIIVPLGVLIIAGSMAVGLYYSIAQDRMGDGFTTAGFIIAVGTLMLAVPITQHYPHCKCWKRKGIMDADSLAMGSMPSA
jgi:hypothetical protein